MSVSRSAPPVIACGDFRFSKAFVYLNDFHSLLNSIVFISERCINSLVFEELLYARSNYMHYSYSPINLAKCCRQDETKRATDGLARCLFELLLLDLLTPIYTVAPRPPFAP